METETRQPRRYKSKLTLALFAVFFAAVFIFLFIYRETLNGYIDILAGSIEKNPFAGFFIFIGVSILSSILSPLSSLPILQPAIIAWGRPLTLFYLMIGWTLGSVLGYAIGHFALSGIARRLFSFKKIDRYQAKISPETQFWIVLIFRLGVPTEITSYVLGIIRYNFEKYMLAVVFSELPFAILAVYSSSALFSGELVQFLVLMAVFVLLVAATSLALKKYFSKQDEK